jgi:hypothetical protein
MIGPLSFRLSILISLAPGEVKASLDPLTLYSHSLNGLFRGSIQDTNRSGSKAEIDLDLIVLR